MQIPRIYQHTPIEETVQLSREAVQHVVSVLRLTTGAVIILFNGDNHEYHGELIVHDKRHAEVKVREKVLCNRESPLNIHLMQGVARGAKMDLIIQKAVELGVNEITPVFTARCNVKLIDERADKRMAHWQQVAISAAEQCGRNQLTTIHPPLDLLPAMQNLPKDVQRLILAPGGSHRLNALPKAITQLTLLVGPEGGFNPQELSLAEQQDFRPITLGPRILRTETAALVAISILQAQLGDL